MDSRRFQAPGRSKPRFLRNSNKNAELSNGSRAADRQLAVDLALTCLSFTFFRNGIDMGAAVSNQIVWYRRNRTTTDLMIPRFTGSGLRPF
jgi:hypothetical protein